MPDGFGDFKRTGDRWLVGIYRAVAGTVVLVVGAAMAK
jgi:hypothetical protein